MYEVFVLPFPGPGSRVLISAGAMTPKWSRARPELFYASRPPEPQIMVVPYAVAGETFRPEKPRIWLQERFERVERVVRGVGHRPPIRRAPRW